MSRPEVKDEPDIEGRTAFMWAASKGADDVILTFVKYGVDIHQTGKNGSTGELYCHCVCHPPRRNGFS